MELLGGIYGATQITLIGNILNMTQSMKLSEISSASIKLEIFLYTITPPLGVDFPEAHDLPIITNLSGHLARVLNLVSFITRMSHSVNKSFTSFSLNFC